jgi:acetyl esterase/lipase
MPSTISRFIRLEMRLIKPILNRLSIAATRKLQDRLGWIGEKTVDSKVTITPVDANGFVACCVSPNGIDGNDERVVLYLHGGGYVAGTSEYACGFASMLAVMINRRVLSVAYRLAPENPFPAALEDAFAAYRLLLDQGTNAKDISFIGESAGGGLIFALCLLLKQKALPLPASLVAVSPWTDLTFSGASYSTNRKKDPSLSYKAIRADAAAYAKGQEKNPLVSPVFGDLSGLPPSLVFAGSYELLLDDARTLADRLNGSGSPCELVIGEGLWHVYVLFRIPEADAAIKKSVSFLELTDSKR